MPPTSWREAAAPRIARVIAAVGTEDPKALRRALRDAYPWGERRMHPYKIWRDEIRRQLAKAGQPEPEKAPALQEPPGPLLALMEPER